MSDDVSADRRRAIEDEYFRKRDRQLMEDMQKRAERDVRRQRMSQRVGVADQRFLDRLESLGLCDETVDLLHVIPLVQVLWAERTVSPRARQQVIDAARRLGIDESSVAGRQLDEWLATRPSGPLFEEALSLLAGILDERTPTEREQYIEMLLDQCTGIAAASGGVLGFGKISSTERELIDRIRRTLA